MEHERHIMNWYALGSVHTELLAIVLALADIAKIGHSTHFVAPLMPMLSLRAQSAGALMGCSHDVITQ